MAISERRLAFLKDVMHTAAEGGVNYWCWTLVYRHEDRPDWAWKIEEHDTHEEGQTTRVYDVTPDVLMRGFRLLKSGESNARLTPYVLKSYDTYGDDGDYDAGDADVIVQLGLFGKVIYG